MFALKQHIILLQLAFLSIVFATNNDMKEGAADRRSHSDRGGLWFGPRLGKRSVRLSSEDRQAFFRLLEAADALKFYYDQLPYYESQANGPQTKVTKKVIFTPKLGRSLSYDDRKIEDVEFTPRLGRRLADDLPATTADQEYAVRIPRHVNDVIWRALVTAGVPAVLEPAGISRGDGKRPDGMSLLPWQRGKPLVWDATCVDTLAASHTPATCRAAGAVAAVAADAKRRRYAALGQSYLFVPFAVETMGPWGLEARSLVKEISSRLKSQETDGLVAFSASKSAWPSKEETLPALWDPYPPSLVAVLRRFST